MVSKDSLSTRLPMGPTGPINEFPTDPIYFHNLDIPQKSYIVKCWETSGMSRSFPAPGDSDKSINTVMFSLLMWTLF